MRLKMTGAWWAAVVVAAFVAVTSWGFGVAQENRERKNSLSGTTWAGRDSDGDDYTYKFEADGTLAYKSPTGSFRNGKWKQAGNAVYFQTNNHYSEYLGEVDGKTVKGKAWNVTGKEWTWQANKK